MSNNKNRVPQFTVPDWLVPHLAEVRAWPAVKGPHPRCTVAACERSAFTLGLCVQHRVRFRAQARRDGVPLADWVRLRRAEVVGAAAVLTPEPVCWVAACTRSATANGLCHAHHRLARYHFRQSAGVVPAGDSESTNHNDA